MASAAALFMVVLGAGWFVSSRDADVIMLVGPSQESVERVAPPTTSPRAAPSARDEQSAPVTTSPGSDDPPTAAASPRAEAAADDRRPGLSTPADDATWVQAVARTFVNIRSAPASDGAVEGVVPENDVVLLGTARGAWREVRSGDLAGWAWEPLFSVSSEGP